MKYYVVDAFTKDLFQGNPAGICVLDAPISEVLMQNIAAENNLAETAFLWKTKSGYDLRWFTPKVEIDLCGHATLASAFLLFALENVQEEQLNFTTKSGVLTVKKSGEGCEMCFPARMPKKTKVTPQMRQAVSAPVLEAYGSRDLLLLVETEAQVKNLTVDLDILKQIPEYFGVIVTAKGETADFVSRFFAPNAGIDEDPVTGSAHATLIPFWAERLGKTEFTAKQLSSRGGTLYCKSEEKGVKIAGKARLYLAGEIQLKE